MQKVYCYVDESGQDDTSRFFVVVAVVSTRDQETIKQDLERIEQSAGTNRKKWHKVRHANRMRYLALLLEQKIAKGEIYAASYEKPIPYFFALIHLTEKAIKEAVQGAYSARVYVDGIDRQKAKELTNALRTSGISLKLVKSRRDESEPLIRLADMWAGCLRSALLGSKNAQAIWKKAKEAGHIHEVQT